MTKEPGTPPGEKARKPVEPPAQRSLNLPSRRGYDVQGYLEKLLAEAGSGQDDEPAPQAHVEPPSVSAAPETKLDPRIKPWLRGLAVAAVIALI